MQAKNQDQKFNFWTTALLCKQFCPRKYLVQWSFPTALALKHIHWHFTLEALREQERGLLKTYWPFNRTCKRSIESRIVDFSKATWEGASYWVTDNMYIYWNIVSTVVSTTFSGISSFKRCLVWSLKVHRVKLVLSLFCLHWRADNTAIIS